jgi:hypothetical protein
MQVSVLIQLSRIPGIELSSSSEDSSPDSLADNQEPCRSGHVKRLTCNTASQVLQDRAAVQAVLAAAKSPRGKKVRKTKLMNTLQLLDKFTLE